VRGPEEEAHACIGHVLRETAPAIARERFTTALKTPLLRRTENAFVAPDGSLRNA